MKRVERTALAVTRWIGSISSLIVHTIMFVAFYVATYLGYLSYDEMLLVLTTIVSLEAIYLSIFIQMTINYTSQAVEDIGEDVEEMQEDIGEIQEDVDELQEDVEDMSEEEEAEQTREKEQHKTLTDIQTDLRKLMTDIDRLRKNTPAAGEHIQPPQDLTK